jgi:hypothetical protein
MEFVSIFLFKCDSTIWLLGGVMLQEALEDFFNDVVHQSVLWTKEIPLLITLLAVSFKFVPLLQVRQNEVAFWITKQGGQHIGFTPDPKAAGA